MNRRIRNDRRSPARNIELSPLQSPRSFRIAPSSQPSRRLLLQYTQSYSRFAPPFPSSCVSVYLPSRSGLTSNTYSLHINGGASMPMHPIAVPALNAASALPPFAASIAKIGNKQASPSPSSMYVGLLLSIPLRVFVAPASSALVSPPTMMPPKRRAKRTEDGLMCAGCRRRKDSTQCVFVTRGMVKRFAQASATKALRITEPSWDGSGAILGFVAGDLEADILERGCGEVPRAERNGWLNWLCFECPRG
jgi:hypothetical protein